MEEVSPTKTEHAEAPVASTAAGAIPIELRKGVRVSLEVLLIRRLFGRC